MDDSSDITKLSEGIRSLLQTHSPSTDGEFLNYKQLSDYAKGVKEVVGEKYIKSILESSYKAELENSGLNKDLWKFPMATFYMHSEILKGRIDMPLLFMERSEYAFFYKEYEKRNQFNSPDAKGVLGTKSSDHVLSIIINNGLSDEKVPLVVRFYKEGAAIRESGTFNRFLNFTWDDVTKDVEKFKSALFDALKNWLIQLGISKDKIEDLKGKPVVERPLEFLYDADWKFPDAWKSVYFVYFPEAFLCSSSSGCVTLLVSEDGGDDDKIMSFIETFARKTREKFTQAASIISRLEAETISAEIKKSTIKYPEFYAVENKNKDLPRMPLLDVLNDISKKDHFKHDSRSLISSIVSAMKFLVYGDAVFTTGYEAITKPIRPAVKETWNNLFGLMPDDNNGLMKALYAASNFEDDLASIPSYREHFIHSFHVFCLGVCILDLLYRNKKGVFVTENINTFQTILKWFFFAAFWHDITYAIEKIDKLGNRYLESIHHNNINKSNSSKGKKKKGNNKENNNILLQPHYGYLLINDEYVNSLSISEQEEYAKPEIWEALVTKEKLQDVFKLCREKLIKVAQHGVLSAVIFKDLFHNCTTKPIENDGVGSISMAMMLHHCLDFINDKDALLGPWKRKPWEKYSIVPSLLMLCDCLAQWGRNFESNEKNEKLKEVKLKEFKYNESVIDIALSYPYAIKSKKMKSNIDKWYKGPITFLDSPSGNCKLHISVFDKKDDKVDATFSLTF